MEVELKCEAEKCVFNLKELCVAPEIHVNGHDTMGGRFTYCNTFSVDVDDSEAVLKEFSKDTKDNYFITSPEIACSAQNCIYNEGEECHAPHVKILGGIATVPVQTECHTFFPRPSQTLTEENDSVYSTQDY
ncbi:MAG: hypothetical protein APF84_06150 [Gracilibacter sp. BRH_c7a]|nr:MAG: hypothetical protein APF84_06150 [Gracilibacter sp. BRH_c7a]